MGLVACPFCREMFEDGEAKQCPVCGVALQAFEKLPPRPENLSEDGVPHEPEWENLPATYLGRGRGALLVLSVFGLALFFLPWLVVDRAGDLMTLDGEEVAHVFPALWVGLAAWFVLMPTVLSRRSIMKMRGARVAVGALAALPGILAGAVLVHVRDDAVMKFAYQWPVWGTIALSLMGVALAFRFGGRVDDLAVRRGSSGGQTLP